MKPASLYIAGPMTGKPQYNWPLFDAVAGELQLAGIGVVNPAAMDRIDKVEFSDEEFEAGIPSGTMPLAGFLKRDFHAMTMCEGIVLLPDWEQSTGANSELLVAQVAGMSTWLWVEGELHPEPNLHANLDLILSHVNKTVWGVT